MFSRNGTHWDDALPALGLVVLAVIFIAGYAADVAIKADRSRVEIEKAKSTANACKCSKPCDCQACPCEACPCGADQPAQSKE